MITNEDGGYIVDTRIADYIFFGNFNQRIEELATMSPEQWSFNDSCDKSILKNYLQATFNKLQEEGKIIETDKYAVFNTGLFTEYFEPIYFYMEPNTHKNKKQPWYLRQIATEYNLGHFGVLLIEVIS